MIPEQGRCQREGVFADMRLPPGVDGVVCLEADQVLHHHSSVSGQGHRDHVQLDVRPLVVHLLCLGPHEGDGVTAGVGERALAGGQGYPGGRVEHGQRVHGEAR